MNGNDDEINTTFLFLIRILDDYLTEGNLCKLNVYYTFKILYTNAYYYVIISVNIHLNTYSYSGLMMEH